MSTLSKIQHFWYEDCTSANAQAEEYLEFSRTSVMEVFFVAKTLIYIYMVKYKAKSILNVT